MDMTAIAALDRAFDRLLEAAEELRAAERRARETGEILLALEAETLARGCVGSRRRACRHP